MGAVWMVAWVPITIQVMWLCGAAWGCLGLHGLNCLHGVTTIQKKWWGSTQLPHCHFTVMVVGTHTAIHKAHEAQSEISMIISGVSQFVFNFWQECMPVGCIPPACCPYLLACTARRGGVYLVPGEGVPGPGAVPGPGGCTWSRGGVPGPGGGVYLPRYSPRLWTEWQTGVKILPCPKLCLRAVKKNTNVYQKLDNDREL